MRIEIPTTEIKVGDRPLGYRWVSGPGSSPNISIERSLAGYVFTQKEDGGRWIAVDARGSTWPFAYTKDLHVLVDRDEYANPESAARLRDYLRRFL